jgi:hypothetical protein
MRGDVFIFLLLLGAQGIHCVLDPVARSDCPRDRRPGRQWKSNGRSQTFTEIDDAMQTYGAQGLRVIPMPS